MTDFMQRYDQRADGLVLAVGTVVGTALLECLSLKDVRGVLSQRPAHGGGKATYTAAWALNLVNHIGIGAPVLGIAAPFLSSPPRPTAERVIGVLLICFIHALVYYVAHAAMHTQRFWWMHRFHHRFHTHVTPVSASAVHPAEYVFAYASPFLAAIYVGRPDRVSILVGTAILSFANLLVHMPRLEKLAATWVPRWIVGTDDHLNHHRKINTHFASPTFNIDYITSDRPVFAVCILLCLLAARAVADIHQIIN